MTNLSFKCNSNLVRTFSAVGLVLLLSSCAATRVGEIIPGKMFAIDSDEVMDFGIELVLASAGRGDLYARDRSTGVEFTGFYSYSPFKDNEGYNTAGNLFGDNKVYTVHLVISPSLGTPSGEGVAKENGLIKYRVVFPVDP